VSERHFTPEEVEALIPTLAEILGSVMKAHAAASEVRERLREERQRITMVGGGVIDRGAWRKDSERLAELTRETEEGLKRVLALGGVPKDLGLGLVDFPHLREGRVVNLCWKYGEQRIRHWHGLDEGYASRKPL
jgi:hypothetical protein